MKNKEIQTTNLIFERFEIYEKLPANKHERNNSTTIVLLTRKFLYCLCTRSICLLSRMRLFA